MRRAFFGLIQDANLTILPLRSRKHPHFAVHADGGARILSVSRLLKRKAVSYRRSCATETDWFFLCGFEELLEVVALLRIRALEFKRNCFEAFFGCVDFKNANVILEWNLLKFDFQIKRLKLGFLSVSYRTCLQSRARYCAESRDLVIPCQDLSSVSWVPIVFA